MAFFDNVKDRFNKAAQSVSNKTKETVEISRLNTQVRNINTELNGIYTQIGLAYVTSKGEDAETLNALQSRAEELLARIDEIERQKAELKALNLCPECGAEMPEEARFCSSCGAKMPEPAPEPEPVAEAEESETEEPAAEEPAQEEDAPAGEDAE